MKTLVCTNPENFEYKEGEKPELDKDTAIIKIKRIGICGTDLYAFEGTQPFFSYPLILGHELSGELVDFDNAPGFEKGETINLFHIFLMVFALHVESDSITAIKRSKFLEFIYRLCNGRIC